METNDYQKQALDFLEKTGTKMDIKFLKTGYHFADDKKNGTKRDIYFVTIMRGSRKISLEFGNSIIDSVSKKAPNEYDILSCLQKYDVGTFENFCSEFGYDEDSITANKTYQAVCNEFKDVQTIWTDEEIELLQEIN